MRRLLAIAALLLAPSQAPAQQTQFPTPFGPSITAPGYTEMCFNSLGLSTPLVLCDSAPNIAKAFKPASPEHRATVVTISPNSGAANGFPSNTYPTTAVGTGTTGAVTATMAAVIGRTNYLCQAQVSALGGTATVGPITLTGLAGGNTLTYQIAATASGNFLTLQFSPCFPASAVNTAIAMATTADGTASAVDVNLLGYVQ